RSSAATRTSPRSSRSPVSTGSFPSTRAAPKRSSSLIRPSRLRNRARALAPALAALLAAGVAGGCGTGGVDRSSNVSNGKQLFTAKCGGCHTLADAGTTGTIGPNLDDAFASDRQQGFSEGTIRQVVRDQIAFASPAVGNTKF